MERRKFVVGLGALAAGSSAAVGTGAFTAAELERSSTINVVDDTNGLIGLEAGSETDFVSDSSGSSGNELEIDLTSNEGGDGVNPNSTYQIGGLSELDENNLDGTWGFPGDGPESPNDLSEVLIDQSTSMSADHAFKVMNQTDSPQNIEVTYHFDEHPGDARVYLVGYYADANGGGSESDEGLVVGNATVDNRGTRIVYSDDFDYSEPIKIGNEFYVTIIVDVGDADASNDLSGTLTVRAGAHDEFLPEE